MNAKRTDASDERSPSATKRLARFAGAVYLALALATAFGFYHAPLVQEDLSVIGRMLTKSDLRFHVAVVADVIAAALSVPLALLLYELFRPIDRLQSALMALFLLVSMPVSFVVALNYVAAQSLLSGVALVAAIPEMQRQALGTLFLTLHTHGVLAVGERRKGSVLTSDTKQRLVLCLLRIQYFGPRRIQMHVIANRSQI